MATQLNQIVAIEKGVKAKANRAFTDAYHTIQKQPLLSGISRTYQPRDDEGDKYPPESTLVQTKVDDIIDQVTEELTRLFDVTATKDSTNALAAADVIVNGQVLVANLTVPTLLFLEKQLIDIRTFVSKLPTLDPSEQWSPDPAIGAWATTPKQTVKTKKIPKNWVKAPATDKHPAQVELFYEDVVEGYWTTVKFSGALPAERVQQILDRVDELTEAVKFAREKANQVEVVDANIGRPIFSYLFGA